MVLVARPARAAETEPWPAPGTHRLIRIGPEVVVSEDDHGRLSMVEEPPPEKTKVDVAQIVLGAMTAGLTLTFYDDLQPVPIGTNAASAGSANR
jgi:hypothetical protein